MITFSCLAHLQRCQNLNFESLEKKTVWTGDLQELSRKWLHRSPLSLAVPLSWLSPPNQSTINPVVAATHLFGPDI